MFPLGGLHVMYAVQMEFGYHLSICSATKENHTKPWSSWPVADADWLLASSSALNTRTLTLVPPICAVALFKNSYKLFLQIPYILESNPNPFYSFRGLKNQMRIRIECGLDSQSRAGFWKNDRAGICDVRTIQLFIILFIILYNIFKYL
jgi:hypothetical protein